MQKFAQYPIPGAAPGIGTQLRAVGNCAHDAAPIVVSQYGRHNPTLTELGSSRPHHSGVTCVVPSPVMQSVAWLQAWPSDRMSVYAAQIDPPVSSTKHQVPAGQFCSSGLHGPAPHTPFVHS